MLISTHVHALENKIITYYEYLDDGSYYEITIEEEQINSRASIVKGNKTGKYIDANGVQQWYVKVTGTFSYNGNSATCTSSSVSTGVYSNKWEIVSQSSSKSGATASANAIAVLYYNGNVIDRKSKTVKLTCSPSGKLS